MMRIVCAGLMALTTITLISVRNASACSCVPSGPPCQNAFQVDAVFAGTVTSISALPDDGPPIPPGQARIPDALRVDFTAVEGFLGIQGPTVSVLTAGSAPACGYEFKPGERYLVYARRSGDGGELRTGICSRTRRLADASQDLRFFEAVSGPGSPQSRVSGTITQWQLDFSTGKAREPDPVADVLVSVRGAERAFEAWTDDRGRYDLTVPPGKYEVIAFPPPAFSPRGLQQTIELRDTRACFVADFAVQLDGRIRGAVRQSSGDPAVGVSVVLMAAVNAGKAAHVETLKTASDGGGGFEFTEVPPGRYVVGVDLVRRLEPELLFPATFHPGTGDAARATVVELDAGQHRELEPMTLPPPRRAYRLTGTVVFEDGRPASDAFISLSDGSATWRHVAAGIKTQSDGTFSFIVHQGLSYVARASFWDAAQRTPAAGSAGPFVVTGDTGPLLVVLTARR